MPPNSPVPRRRYHHGSLPAALVEAAAQLAVERSPARLSLREVARRVGVSEAAPYHYFRNRAALLAAVADEGYRTFDTVLSAAMSESADPVRRLGALAASYVRFAIDRPHYFTVLFRSVADAPRARVPSRLPHQQLLDAARAARVASGHDDADAAAAAAMMWAVPHGLALLYLDGLLGTTVTPRMLEELARAAMGPLASAPLDELDGEQPWGV